MVTITRRIEEIIIGKVQAHPQEEMEDLLTQIRGRADAATALTSVAPSWTSYTTLPGQRAQRKCRDP